MPVSSTKEIQLTVLLGCSRNLHPQLTVGLLTGDALDVDDPLPAVNSRDFALTALRGRSNTKISFPPVETVQLPEEDDCMLGLHPGIDISLYPRAACSLHGCMHKPICMCTETSLPMKYGDAIAQFTMGPS